MDRLKLRAHGKINLYLDILGRRADGYHNVVTVLQSLQLADLISIFPSQKLEVICPTLNIPSEDNLAYQAASILRQEIGVRQEARIEITKNIPVAAGLGGGSADAAATLVGLNLLWGLGLSLNALQVIGAKVGADVPFCLQGGAMLAEGKGERLRALNSLPDVVIVLAILPIRVSTEEAYGEFDAMGLVPLRNPQAIVEALNEGDLTKAVASLANIFEKVVAKKYPQIIELKNKAREAGASGVLMSGSGGAIFALVSDTHQASEVIGKLESLEVQTMVTRPFHRGVEVLKE